jgi:hypothetical protein
LVQKRAMQTRPPSFVDLLFRLAAGKCDRRSCDKLTRPSDDARMDERPIDVPRTKQTRAHHRRRRKFR